MQTLAQHPELFAALAIGAVLMMAQLGLSKGALALKRSRRPCPSCGRIRHAAVCEWCGQKRHARK
jgi:recombinational DNA repair protein RecR